MAHTLESLVPGTPVFVGENLVGDVRAVYASQGSRQADLLVVHWTARGEAVAVPAAEVASVDDGGVRLISQDAAAYETLVAFDAARFPTVHQLS